MRLSLDTIGYGGYFTAPGEQLGLDDAVRRAAQFGYDAACIYAHRPLGFPLDLDRNRRQRLKALYSELDPYQVSTTYRKEEDHEEQTSQSDLPGSVVSGRRECGGGAGPGRGVVEV
jgi:hypothetical protein